MAPDADRRHLGRLTGGRCVSDAKATRGDAWFDVRLDHGAVGDGDANDGPAVQAALAAAGSAGAPAVVHLRAGTYSTDRCLDVPDNVTVRGDGIGRTIIKGRSGLASVRSVNGGYTLLGQASGASENIAVRDLTVDAHHAGVGVTSSSTYREHSSIVDFRGIAGLTFENVEVKNGWFWHLTSWHSSDVMVRNCRVTGPGTTGMYDQCDGIHLASVTRGSIIGCHVDQGAGQDGDDGIAIHVFPGDGACTDVVIADNIVRGGHHGSGIDLANSDGMISGVAVGNNVIWGCHHEGIVTNWFSSFTGSTQDVVIANNVVRDCGAGIVLGDSSGNDAPYRNFVVSGNLCSRSGGAPSQVSTANSSNINHVNNYTGA
jgi:parallel beta-helix repeat protein